MKFQTLIDRLNTFANNPEIPTQLEFQTLIDRLNTEMLVAHNGKLENFKPL